MSAIGYGVALLGLLHAIGLLLSFPAALFLPRLAPRVNRMKLFAILDILNGFGCFAAGVALFRVLGVEITLALPIILGLRSLKLIFPRRGREARVFVLPPLDFFQLARMIYYDWSVAGIGGGAYRAGLVLDYDEKTLPMATTKGLLRDEDVAWANEQVMVQLGKGQVAMTRREIAKEFVWQGLLNWPSGHPFYERFVRGLMIQALVTEFVQLNAQHSTVSAELLMRSTASDVNSYFGILGFQDLSQKQVLMFICHVIGVFGGWLAYASVLTR